jgi:hypothetical protein
VNKSEKKRLRKEMEEKADIASALGRVRSLGEDISIRGIGILKIQLSAQPSFDEGESWDFREIDNTINVYRARINTEKREYYPGYQVVENGEDIAKELLDFLQSNSLPLVCLTDNTAYCDGTSYQITIENGFGNYLVVSWGENVPEEWVQFTNKYMYFLELLRKAVLIEYEV